MDDARTFLSTRGRSSHPLTPALHAVPDASPVRAHDKPAHDVSVALTGVVVELTAAQGPDQGLANLTGTCRRIAADLAIDSAVTDSHAIRSAAAGVLELIDRACRRIIDG